MPPPAVASGWSCCCSCSSCSCFVGVSSSAAPGRAWVMELRAREPSSYGHRQRHGKGEWRDLSHASLSSVALGCLLFLPCAPACASTCAWACMCGRVCVRAHVCVWTTLALRSVCSSLCMSARVVASVCDRNRGWRGRNANLFQSSSTTKGGQHCVASHSLTSSDGSGSRARKVLDSAVRDWRLPTAALSETSVVMARTAKAS